MQVGFSDSLNVQVRKIIAFRPCCWKEPPQPESTLAFFLHTNDSMLHKVLRISDALLVAQDLFLR